MAKKFNLALILNKSNNQISVNLPRRKLSKKVIKNINLYKRVHLFLEGFE